MHLKYKIRESLTKSTFWVISILLISTLAIAIAQSTNESQLQYLGQKVFNEKGCGQCDSVFCQG